MPVTSVAKQLVTFAFLILGVVSFVFFLYGFSGSSIQYIANYQNCPSPNIPNGATPPPGYVPCDYGWKYQHAVLIAEDWNLYQCLGKPVWAPSVIVYLDKSTGSYLPPCGNTVYFLGVGLFGLISEVAYYGYEVALKYRGAFVLSFVGAGNANKPTAYGNTIFDFHIIKERLPYTPEIFGVLKTSAQLDLAKKLSDKEAGIHAELVQFEANDTKGQELLIYNKHPNESMNYGEPKTVQMGFFPRKVAGTALVTGVYLGRAVTPIIPRKELEKYGIEDIPTWQKQKLLSFIQDDAIQEEIPWYFIDDCDARRQEVQNAIFKGTKAENRLITVDDLNAGKLQAFLTFIIGLPFQKQAEIEKQRAEDLEDKLAELEKHGIRMDNVKRGPEKEEFKFPEIPRWLEYLIIGAACILLAYLSYSVIAPSVERFLLQQDLNQINILLQTATPSTKDALLKSQAELQQAIGDINTHGAGALREAQAALNDAGKAIAAAISPQVSTNSIISSTTSSATNSLNTNSTSSSVRV